MADDGWIKLHRKLMENPIFLNPNLLQIFIYCLLKANHKDNEMIWNDELMTVKTGSFITGRLQMAKDLKQKDSALYKRLQLLTKLGYIELKSNNKFTLLTIVKYKSYQVSESKEEQQSNNKVTTKEQQSNTNNNDNNDKNDKKTYDFDFVWNQYPNRIGRKQALRHFKASVKTDNEYTDIKRALENYKKSDKVAKGFVQNGSTWFNNWQDWIPQEMQIQKPKTKAEIDALWGELAE